MDHFFDNQRILNLIWRRKFHFTIVGFVAIMLSALFSGPAFITPKFKSTARLYPVNTRTYSNESETEQMLEILNSNDLKFKLFESFDLHKVYKIDKQDPLYLSYMLDIYNTNVRVAKTEYETAEIKVLDEDPKRAAAMCDSIIAYYHAKVNSMHKIKAKEMVAILGRLLNKKHQQLDVYKKQLDSLRTKYGIISYSGQVPEITRGYMNALAAGRGNSSDTKKIETLYGNFSAVGTQAAKLENNFNKTIHSIDSLSVLHEKYLMEYEKEITYGHVVESSFPADKKSYPVRWLIVLFTTFSAGLFSLLVFLVLDYRKEM